MPSNRKNMNLDQIYSQRIEQFSSLAEGLKARYTRFSFVRLAVFIIGIGISIYLFTTHFGLGIGFVVLFLLLFARFIFWHQAILRAQRHNEELVRINKREQRALAHDYTAFGSGKEFVDPQHPYTVDLDLFGDYSYFQYCNRTVTAIGKQTLANYFKQPATINEIKARQEAITELKSLLDWRQDFQALGKATNDDIQHVKALNTWLNEEPYVSTNSLLKMAFWILPFVGIASIVYGFMKTWLPAILLFSGVIYLLRQYLERITTTHNHTAKAEEMLAAYARLIGHIEQKEFTSTKLVGLREAFLKNGQHASKRIKRLSYIIGQLNVRYNAFAFILNLLGLWDLQWINQLEKWKAEQKELLPHWFDSLQEYEALISLATVYHNNPEWTFASIHDQSFLEAKNLAHPLINPTNRVGNDFETPTSGHLKLMTGSNMAGKSTFLRSVGLNIVLAMSGAPVCADRFSLPILQVYTSMRTQDALHESTSSFYAELKRLKTIIEAVDSNDNIFFLLDEILKGTNSNDRHKGAKALIIQLIKSKGAGIIATHDLELGALEATSDGAVENLCIEVEIKDGKLFFDYKLKKGVSQSFNATILMKEMGIRIED